MITKALAGNNAVSTAQGGAVTGAVRAPEGAVIVGAKDNSPFQTAMNKNRFDLARIMLLACPYCSPSVLGDLNWKIRKIAFEITNFGTPFICEFDSEEEEEEEEEEEDRDEDKNEADDIVAVVKSKRETNSCTVSARTAHSVSFSHFGSKHLKPISPKSSGMSDGCIKLSRDRYCNTSSNNSSTSTLSRMPPIIIRPSPYARMMSSTFLGNDRIDRQIERGEWERMMMTSRSISSDVCSPRSPITINLLHGLYVINTDLWRLVITYL